MRSSSLIGVIVFIALVVFLSATLYMLVKITQNYEENSIYPSNWSKNHEIYGVYNNKTKMYNLVIKNVSTNILITTTVNTSHSMAPTFGSNTKLLYYIMTDDEKKNLSIGDLIIFKNPKDKSMLICHRIVYKVETKNTLFFYTKGDDNKMEDSFKVYPDMIVGKIIGIIY